MDFWLEALLSLINYSFLAFLVAIIVREAMRLFNLAKYWKQGMAVKYFPIFGSLVLFKSSAKDEDGLSSLRHFFKCNASSDVSPSRSAEGLQL